MQTLNRHYPINRSVQPQKPEEKKPIGKSSFSTLRLIFFFVFGLSFLWLLESQYSILSIILVGIVFSFLAIAIFLNYRKKKDAKLLGKVAVGFAIFMIAFGGAGYYLQNYAGPTVPPVGQPDILNLSLTEQLQTVTSSPSFQFQQIEHLGTLTFEDLSIHSTYSNAPQGGVTWHFYAGDVKTRFIIGQTSGKAYNYNLGNYGQYSLPSGYPSDEQILDDFRQIDARGLNWFYNQAVSEYQNATKHSPVFSALAVDVGFTDLDNYSGMTLTISARRENGNGGYPLVFEAAFLPDGTILKSTNLPS
jgi:hypothetical protein